MRLPGPPSDEDFERALTAARNGRYMTDTGLGEAVQAFIVAVMKDPSEANVAAARAAFHDHR